MKKVQLFSYPICKQYKAPRLSIPYLFSVFCTVLTFTIPFYLCFSPRYALKDDYNTDFNVNERSYSQHNTLATPVGIWLKHDTYREQPKVQFQYKVIFVAQAKEKKAREGAKNEGEYITLPKEIFYSTMGDINQARTCRTASTVSREADDNLDGVVDRLLIQIKLPLQKMEDIYSVQALVFVTYKLEAHVKMEMQSLVYVQHQSNLPGLKLSSTGDLNLRQMMPIPIVEGAIDSEGRKKSLKLFDDEYEQLLNVPSVSMVSSESNVQNILRKYESRSIATDYSERFSVWSRQIDDDHNLDADNSSDGENSKDFELDLTIVIPKMQSVVYIPTLMEVVTEAWIRYLSLLVVVGCFIRQVLTFVFSNQILKSYEQ